MKGMFDVMKKAQEMQKNLQKAQDDLKLAEVTGSSAGGLVTVVMSGAFEVKSVRIKPEAVDADDIATLEDVVQVAMNDAVAKVRALTESTLSAATGGLKLPGIM